MATANSMEFVVANISHKLNVGELKKALISTQRLFIAHLETNGKLYGLPSTGTHSVYPVLIGNQLTDFCWESSMKDGSHCCLVAISLEQHLVRYQVKRSSDGNSISSTCLSHCHVNTLQSILREAVPELTLDLSKLKLLGCYGEEVILRCEDHLIRFVFHDEQPPEVTAVCQLGNGIIDASLLHGVITSLQSNNTYSFYSLDLGLEPGILHLPSEHQIHSSKTHVMSSNCQRIAIVLPDQKLAVVNLDQYFTHQGAAAWQELVSEFATESISGSHFGSASISGDLTSLSQFPVDTVSMNRSVAGDTMSLSQSFSDTQSVSGMSMAREDSFSETPVLRRSTSHGGKAEDAAWKQKLNQLQSKPSTSHWQLYQRSNTPRPPTQAGERITVQKKVVGFKKSATSAQPEESSPWWSEVALPSSVEGYVVEDIAMEMDYIYVWYRMPDRCHSIVLIICAQDLSIREHVILTPGYVLLPKQPLCPIHLLAESNIKMIAFGSQQVELINLLMLYDCAATADTLCRLNAWDRCSIPLHSLEVGLKHRQLDTVAFFLKSRENVFTANKKQSHTEVGEDEVEQVHSAIKLLITTITEHIDEKLSRSFAEQLMHITLKYLHKVAMKIVAIQQENKNPRSKTEISNASQRQSTLDQITCYISQLRRLKKVYMKDGSHPQGQGQRSLPPDVGTSRDWLDLLTPPQRAKCDNWQKQPEKAVLIDGILDGQLPLLQSYLLYRGAPAHLSHIVEFGQQMTLDLLLERKLPQAERVLANLGLDVWNKLRAVCFYTTDRQLRDYLVEELTKVGMISEEEKQMHQFVCDMEQLYSCLCFEHACTLRKEEDTNSNWQERTDLSCLLGESKSDLVTSACHNFTPVDISNTENSGYSCIILEWVRHWSPETRARILMDQIMQHKDCPIKTSIPSQVVAGYLSEHVCLEELQLWANSYLASSCSSSSSSSPVSIGTSPISPALPSLPHSSPSPATTWPYNLPLEQISGLQDAPQFLQDIVLDILARKGVFSEWETDDLSHLLHRLGRIAAVISPEHVLDLNPHLHNVSSLSFHSHVIDVAVRDHLPHLLFHYLDHYRLQPSLEELVTPSVGSNLPHWIDMLWHFRQVGQSNTDFAALFAACLSAARFVSNRSCDSLSSLIAVRPTDPVLLAGALVYAPDLQQFLKEPSEAREMLKMHLESMPRLHRALFPTAPSSQNQPNIYQLLQDDVPFDIGRLFSWQTTNPYSVQDGNVKMPHFSHEELVNRFAHEETLNFTYYLRQGRPSFAFCALVLEQIKKGARSFSNKCINSVCAQVDMIAVRHFHHLHIATACIAFVEMLARDSTHLRIHLQAASLLFDHLTSASTSSTEERHRLETSSEKLITHLMLSALKPGKKFPAKLVIMLEEATRWQINKNQIESVSMEACKTWLLAVMFTQCHGLPLPEGFLLDCAHADDWLMFLLFAQLHNYQKEQLLQLLPEFKSVSLREHLKYVVQNVTHVMEQNKDKLQGSPSVKRRDVRAQLYSKIGLPKKDMKKNQGGSSCTSSDDEESRSMDTITNSVNEPTSGQDVSHEVLVLPDESAASDLFTLLFACIGSSQPSRCLTAFAIRYKNEVLAVLAACFPQHHLLSCFCSWILASTPSLHRQQIMDQFKNVEEIVWTETLALQLTLELIKVNSSDTLLDAFKIFSPDCVIVPLLEFARNFCFHYKGDEEIYQKSLNEFKAAYYKLRSSEIARTSAESDSLFRVSWVECVAAALLRQLLVVASKAEVDLLLRLLDESGAGCLFERPVADFTLLHRLHKICQSSGVCLNIAALLTPSSSTTLEKESTVDEEESNVIGPAVECNRLLEEIIGSGHFNEARLFAETAGLNTQNVTIRQLHSDLDSHQCSELWAMPAARCLFWWHCNDVLKRHSISPEISARFFMDQISGSGGCMEKGLISKLAYDWLTQANQAGQEELDNLFRQIWRCRIAYHVEKRTHVNKEEFDSSETFAWPNHKTEKIFELNHLEQAPRSELLEWIEIPGPPDESVKSKLSKKEEQAFGMLLGDLLKFGHIKEACRVVDLFDHYSLDLDIIKSCVSLSKGELQPNLISRHLKKRLAQRQGMRRRQSSSSMITLPRLGSKLSLASIAMCSDTVDVETDVVMKTMETLLDVCQYSSTACERVIINYRIAKALERPFEWTVLQDAYQLLKLIIDEGSQQLYALTKMLIKFSGLKTSKVSRFLGDTIIDTLNAEAGVGQHDEVTASQPLTLGKKDKVGSLEGISDLIQLCDDSSLLGHHLLAACKNSLSNNMDLTSAKVLKVAVELTIYAHDCFTLACNMEGISAILHVARPLAEALRQAGEFNLMIHLLTGVGRFTEMTFIFDLLKQDDQFELLFRKGIDKEESLRLAVLEYLQRYHPSDTDTFTMVSLHFTMYREIAQMLERSARSNLARLSDRTIDASDEILSALKRIVHDFSGAADSYTMENCMRHADTCMKSARLVALQLHLLTSGQKLKIINLSVKEVENFLRTHHKFYEAYLVAEAYGITELWSVALCSQVILRSDWRYLTDYQRSLPLTSARITEVTASFKSEGNKPSSAYANMRKLLALSDDILVQYRLANELGFTDMTRELIKGASGAYIQDRLTDQY